MEKNPLIEPEDFFAPYREKVEELKNKPQVIEFDKLTYEIFARTADGKKWLEIVKENYLIPAISPNAGMPYEHSVIWGEGFKEFIRKILCAIKAHDQRIMAGQNK